LTGFARGDQPLTDALATDDECKSAGNAGVRQADGSGGACPEFCVRGI